MYFSLSVFVRIQVVTSFSPCPILSGCLRFYLVRVEEVSRADRSERSVDVVVIKN